MLRVRPAGDAIVLATSLVAIGAATLLLRAMPGVSPTTVALVLLLIVLATATIGRLRAAIAASVVATLTLNFYFLPPVGTFTIADPQNWIALFAFLVVAVIASQLSAATHARAQEAIARRNEVTRLFDLTRDVLLTTETTGAIDALARHISRRFALTQVAICLPGERGWRVHQGGQDDVSVDANALDTALAKARAPLAVDTRQRTSGGHVRADERGAVAIVPLRQATKTVGLLAVASSSLDTGTLDAIAGVAAIAIERAQFLADRDAAELVRQKADLAATLLASLSHDLRTPLTAIKVAVENLGGDLAIDDRQSQSAAASSEIDRLTRLFQDILDMARIDSAAIRVDRQWVTPADVVDAAMAHVRLALVGRTVRADADMAHQVDVDPRLVSVALSHLLENAAQYSPPTGEILVQARTDAAGLHVSVTDQGQGIDPAELAHLFERFYRGRSARQGTFGTGMGLSITRGLLAAAGGQVWVENVPGSGARFTIAVPGAVRSATGVDSSDGDTRTAPVATIPDP